MAIKLIIYEFSVHWIFGLDRMLLSFIANLMIHFWHTRDNGMAPQLDVAITRH